MIKAKYANKSRKIIKAKCFKITLALIYLHNNFKTKTPQKSYSNFQCEVKEEKLAIDNFQENTLIKHVFHSH